MVTILRTPRATLYQNIFLRIWLMLVSDALSPPLVSWKGFDRAFEGKSSSQGWTSQSGTLPLMHVMCFNIASAHPFISIGKLSPSWMDNQYTQALHFHILVFITAEPLIPTSEHLVQISRFLYSIDVVASFPGSCNIMQLKAWEESGNGYFISR